MRYLKYSKNRTHIEMAADWEFPGSELAPEEVVRGSDGKLYLASELPEPSINEVKADALRKVDAITSDLILAGFDYETDPGTGTPEVLHFSYDSFDQQNFADSAIAMQLGSTVSDAIPTSTPWNAYRDYTPETGGELIVLQLTAETFLPLYSTALTHKATKMAEGSSRKALIESATSIKQIQELLVSWGIEEGSSLN